MVVAKWLLPSSEDLGSNPAISSFVKSICSLLAGEKTKIKKKRTKLPKSDALKLFKLGAERFNCKT